MSATDNWFDPRKQVLGNACKKQLCEQQKERKKITTKNRSQERMILYLHKYPACLI